MKAEIRTFLTERLLSGRDLADDEDLLVGGLVDSLGVMRLVAFIEGAAGFKVPARDLTLANFATVDAIARYVEGRAAR